MSAYMKLDDLEGEATDQSHPKWVLVDAMSFAIHRSIQPGAKDNERRGATTISDVTIVRQLDRSSVPLQVACAVGTVFDQVEIHFCTDLAGKREPFLKYKLWNVIVSSYTLGPCLAGASKPTESIELNSSAVEWTYVTMDRNSLGPGENITGSYDLGSGEAR
jgi:type VI secretion system secreted protein Hcp